MPTPQDHRDITIVVNSPPSTVSATFDLAYVDQADATLYVRTVVDTDDTDVTYRQFTAFVGGALVLDVRTRLSVHATLSPNQTSTKLVDQWGKPQPAPSRGTPQAPASSTEEHFWTAEGLEVELTVQAQTLLGAATVQLLAQPDGRWDIVIHDANDQLVASGSLLLPRDAVEQGRFAATG